METLKDKHFMVPSLGRAGISSTLDLLKKESLLKDTCIFCYDFESDDYKREYPEATIVTCGTQKCLARKRNMIIDYAKEHKFNTIMMIDDDISYFLFKNPPELTGDKKVEKTKDLDLVYSYLYDLMILTEWTLSGIIPRYNFIYTANVSNPIRLFTRFSNPGGMLFLNMNKISETRYDESMKLEDLDFFIQSCLNAEEIIKINNLQMNARMGKNKGGYQNYICVQERFKIGYNQIIDKYENANQFISMNESTGMTSFSSVKFKQWLLDNDYYFKEELEESDKQIETYSKKLFDKKFVLVK